MLRIARVLGPLLLAACSSSTFAVAEPADDSGGQGGDTSSGDASGVDSTASDSSGDDITTSDAPGPDVAVDGTPVDAAPACPMPANTKKLDFKSLDCGGLSAKYAEAVKNAQTCGCTADCSSQVCETFCCNCKTYVNPGSEAYAEVTSLSDEWKIKGCSIPCTDSLCAPASLKGCLPTGTGVGKQCTSIHGAP